MKILIYLVVMSIILAFFIGCAAHSTLEPVGKGRLNANLSVGGPIVAALDTHIPIPYFTTGCDYGISDRTNICGNLHLLPLAYSIAGGDFGAAYFPVMNDGYIPTWGVQARMLFLSSLKSDVPEQFKMYPVISTSAAWKCGKGNIYTGCDLSFRLNSPDYDNEASNYIVSPFAGYRWNITDNYRLLFELKMQGVNLRTDQLAVDYIPIANHGAFTTFFAVERCFR